MSEDQHYGGLTSVLLTKIMGDLGITQEIVKWDPILAGMYCSPVRLKSIPLVLETLLHL